jgi:hypothetical protein
MMSQQTMKKRAKNLFDPGHLSKGNALDSFPQFFHGELSINLPQEDPM